MTGRSHIVESLNGELRPTQFIEGFRQRGLLVMPIRQYFLWVGSILLVGLFLTDWFLPEPAAHPHSQIPPNERVNLQIRSNYKWPARVVLDTTQTAHPFIAATDPEPSRVKSLDLSAMEHRGLPNVPSAPATDDKASAIQAKPVHNRLRMTGTIEAD